MAKSRPGLLWASVFCLLAAVGAFFIAREQDRIRSLYGAAPQPITVAQLADQGYGDNIWVDLTDVELIPKFVTQTRKGNLSAVWVAAFPQGQADRAREIKVILRSTRCQNEAEIAQKFQPRASYRGAVINPTLLQPYTPYRSLLQDAFPDLKLAQNIWEVDIDYLDKPSAKWASRFDAATVLLACLGVFCGIAWCLLPAKPAVRDEEWSLAKSQDSNRVEQLQS